MSAERPSKDKIFNAAAELVDAAERQAYLSEVCGDDPQLRVEIEDLLERDLEAGSFLESPPPGLGATIDQPITEEPGTQIGPYKLLQQIGEGGMGVVYMAEQKEPVKRRVALKIIKPGMDTRQVIARFEAERQALAMMDHPNIAKVLDAGQTDSGRPYFVMELVKGISVTQYCDEQHLTPKERLELFVPICQAVQHAHQKGIIHRDIKPSNILVALFDGQPVPKVIDFGVAKATGQSLTEKTMFTQLGQVVGTLEYMSPEQAQVNQLDVDTRSDIYSLGVLLYELLTGDTPFDRTRLRSAAFDEMLRIIREEEPPKPSTKISSSQSLPSIAANRHVDPQRLTSSVRGELDWIVMKALEKDRARRYETASKFAEDVQHYLNDEPVVACPPSAAYRFRKFARRYRTQLATAGVLALALLVVVGGVGWAVRDRAAQRADVARERVERQQRITNQVELLLADVDQLASEQDWEAALDTARRAQAVLAGSEGAGLVNEQVEAALRELEFVARLADIRMQASAWISRRGESFERSAAARAYRTAFRDFGVDVEVLPAAAALARLRQHPRIALRLAIALDEYVDQLSPTGADETNWRPLLDVARGLDADPLRNQLRAMWGQEVTPQLQSKLGELVDGYEVQKHSAETANKLALRLQRTQLLKLQEQVLRQAQRVFPDDFWLNLSLGNFLANQQQFAEAMCFTTAAVAIKPDSAVAHLNLGRDLASQGKLDEAIACCQRALELHPKLALAHHNLGRVLHDQGKLDEAVARYRRAIELDPTFVDAHNNLGNALKAQRKLDEAIACYRKALELDPTYAFAHSNLGNALKAQGKLDEAIACCRKAIELDPTYACFHANLGNALDAQEELEEALAAYQQAREIEERLVEQCPSVPDYQADLAGTYNNLGLLYSETGKHEEALATYEQAREICERLVEQSPLVPRYQGLVADVYTNLGRLYSKTGKPEEALVACQQAREFRERLVEQSPLAPTYQFALALTVGNLGFLYSETGKPDEALAAYEQAREICERLVEQNPTVPEYQNLWAGIYANLGNLYSKTGKPEGALAAYQQAREIWERLVLEYPTVSKYRVALRNRYLNLGRAHAGQNKLEQAIAAYRRAIKLDPKSAMAHRHLGDLLQKKGDTSGAIDAYSTCIELSPDGSGPHNNFGLALRDAGRTAEAAVAFENAVAFFDRLAKAEPNNKIIKRNLTVSLTNLAKSHLALGNQQAHEEACQSLAALFPPVTERNVADWGHLGQALYRAGQYGEARAALEKVVELRRDEGPSLQGGPRWWYLAMSLARVGEDKRAREIYEQLSKQAEQAKPLSDVTRRLRADTAEVLGIEMRND